MLPDPALDHLVGVYDADGGVVGEARYFLGHLLGILGCSLCDITHSPVRRKPAWDAMVAGLGVPFRLRHRNELTPALAAAVARSGVPVVLGVLADGSVHPVLDAAALGRLDGSVAGFGLGLAGALADAPWRRPAATTDPRDILDPGSLMDRADLTIYTTAWCPYCSSLTRALARAGQAYVEIDVDADPGAAAFVEGVNGGDRTVPTVLLADGRTLTNPSVHDIRAAMASL
ncbi:MAG: mycoredoxin [Candidatus Nanopelagicales bacterium]